MQIGGCLVSGRLTEHENGDIRGGVCAVSRSRNSYLSPRDAVYARRNATTAAAAAAAADAHLHVSQ